MTHPLTFEQSIWIDATPEITEKCVTDITIMHQWLNPLLSCGPEGEWTASLGDRCRFFLQLPVWQPNLECVVVERSPGLIVWKFEGFFVGCDRWQCIPEDSGTRLINRFEFEIPHPLVSFGFKVFAQALTKRDMQAQLQRLQQIAESWVG